MSPKPTLGELETNLARHGWSRAFKRGELAVGNRLYSHPRLGTLAVDRYGSFRHEWPSEHGNLPQVLKNLPVGMGFKNLPDSPAANVTGSSDRLTSYLDRLHEITNEQVEKVLKMTDCPRCGHTVMEPNTKCGYCGRSLGHWWGEGRGLPENGVRAVNGAIKRPSVAAWARQAVDEAVSVGMVAAYPKGAHSLVTRGPVREQLPTQMGSEPGKLAHYQVPCDRCGGNGCQDCNYYGYKARGMNSHEGSLLDVQHQDVRSSLEKALENLNYAHRLSAHPDIYSAIQSVRRLLRPKSSFHMDT
ncbi:MAG TPA: hypothetical protein VFV92_07045 [Candidatus Bathyarchaeia archaeon]|nr:hypothetical protein [Candidatus Bathyarchaeia archaeon]